MDESTNGPNIAPGDFQVTTWTLVISMRKAETILTENGSSEELLATEKLVRIYIRLPRPIQGKWSDKLFKLQEKDQKSSVSHILQTLKKTRKFQNQFIQ